jgi:hypothetical protein
MTPELTKRITFHLKWYFEVRLNTDHEIVRKAVKNELRKIMSNEASLGGNSVDEFIGRFRILVSASGMEVINEKEVTNTLVLRQQS